MADTVTTQVYNGEKNYVVTIENFSDGTGQSNVTIVDASAIDAGVITNLVLWRCSYNVKGGNVVIGWEDTSVIPLLVMGETGIFDRDFSEFGGLKNPRAVQNSGNVVLSTYGFMLNSSYSITLEFRKMGARTAPMPTLDLDFANNNAWNGSAYVAPSTLITTSRASTAYADNLAGTWTSFGNNVPRITNKGLLVEEARTNSIRNNSMQGASAPSTLPTNWTTTQALGLTVAVNAVGITLGVDYIDIRISGTASSGTFLIALDAINAIAASQNQVWQSSFFAGIVGGTTTNISSIAMNIQQVNAALTNLQNNATTSTNIANLTSTIQRFAGGSLTLNQATVAFIRPSLSLVVAAGSVDITLRYGWPQLELGTFATSPIRTTNATVTRALDVITATNPLVFGTGFSAFAAAFAISNNTTLTGQKYININDGSSSNWLSVGRSAGITTSQCSSISGGVNSVMNGANWVQNTFGKVAAGTTNGSQGSSFNGATPVIGTGALPVNVNQVNIGGGPIANSAANAYISRVSVWPTTRLTNDQLQRLTSL